MANRRPLVFLSDNRLSELPAGDTVSWNWLADVPANITEWAGLSPTTDNISFGAARTTNMGLEIGGRAGVATSTFIDFHTGAVVTDYDARIIATGGTGVAGGGTLSLQAASVTINGSEVAPVGRGIIAGDGLTGGGDLSANRTITLGTPSSLSGTTTNAVTTTSHTHELLLIHNAATGTDAASTYPGNITTTGSIVAGSATGGSATHITGRSNSDNRVLQLLSSNAGGSIIPELYFRTSHTTTGGGGWTAAQRVWHDGNFTPSSKADASDTVNLTGAQSITGAKTFQHTTGVGIVIDRTSNTTNSTIEAKTTAGSVFFGQGSAGYFDIGTAANLTSSANRWMRVDGTGVDIAGGQATLNSATEARVALNCSGGRNVRLLSNSTPNAGFYDASNSQWMLRIDAANDLYVSGSNVYVGTAARLRSSGVHAILSVTGGGTIYLRPNGDGSTTGQFTIDASGNVVASAAVTAAGQISDAIGDVRSIPQRLNNASSTMVLTDAGKHIISTNTSNYSWTIPPNSSVAFPLGTAITFVHDSSSGTKTLTQGSGVTIVRGTTTGNIALAAGEVVTLLKVGTNRWRAV